jgi:vacuolar-type H+-ATPase subunit B/Vma2
LRWPHPSAVRTCPLRSSTRLSRNSSISSSTKVSVYGYIVSEMNQRAKEISLKTMMAIFNHPVADINIAINECLKICREELNLKFVPVDKLNPRIVESRLEIIAKILTDLPKEKTKKISYDAVLKYLIEGAIYHSHNDVRTLGVKTLELIYKEFPQGTIEWYKSLVGLKPNISSEI